MRIKIQDRTLRSPPARAGADRRDENPVIDEPPVALWNFSARRVSSATITIVRAVARTAANARKAIAICTCLLHAALSAASSLLDLASRARWSRACAAQVAAARADVQPYAASARDFITGAPRESSL